MLTFTLYATTNTTGHISTIVVDANIYVDELYFDIAVDKGDVTIPAPSSGTEQRASELSLIPQVTRPDITLL